MRKTILLILALASLGIAQARFGHGGGSLDLSTLLPIIADSSKWTDGSTVNAIKPRDAKTVEADSVKAGALEVTGNARFNSNVTMITTAGEQVQLGTGSDDAPELSSAGDTNTGIRFPGGDKMQFVQNGLNSHTFRPYRYTITYSDGDTLGISLDGTRGYIQSSCPLRIQATTAGYLAIGASPIFNWNSSAFYPNTHDSYTLGTSGNYIKDLYVSDNVVLGSNGQTATFTWGQQKTMTEQADSTGILDMYNGSPRIRMMNADGRLGLSYNSGSVVQIDSSNTHKEASVIADDGTITLVTGVAGRGSVQIGNNEQWAWFTFTSAGDVTLVQNSAKVSRTATAGDDSLMVYDGGSGIVIKNRLGATKVIDVDIKYFAP